MSRLLSLCLAWVLTACTVPSIEELHPCDIASITGAQVDAVLGDKATCRAIRVTIRSAGFVPGCVSVKVRDERRPVELSTFVTRTRDVLVIGVLPPKDWSPDLQVEAIAYEQSCESGLSVVSATSRAPLKSNEPVDVTLSLQATDADGDGYVSVFTGGTDCNDNNAAIHPGAAELCNDVDDNCNGISDQVELSLGQSCTMGVDCPGIRACGQDGGVICNAPDAVYAYPDRDQDGRGDMHAEPLAFCAGIGAGYVLGPADDCDDTNPSIRPGAPELCNGVDDNCDGAIDETFPQLGAACEVAGQCPGTQVCDTSQTGTTCQATVPVSTWSLDEDGDGFGGGLAVQACTSPGPGFVDRDGDCNDGNPFTYPGAPEICDGLDNNCDGSPDGPGVCPEAGASFVPRLVGAPERQWRSIFTETPGDVTVVGNMGGVAVLTPGSTTFQLSPAGSGCGNDNPGYNAVWVDMADLGRGYMGSSASGLLRFFVRSEDTCTQAHQLNNVVQGLVGFRHNGALEIHGVTSTFSGNQGLTFLWNGGNGAGSLTTWFSTVAPLYDVHGRSRTALFAVGGYDTGNNRARIYRYTSDSSPWQTEDVQNSIPTLGRLQGVWVVNDKLAFAVGDFYSGTNSVVRWDGNTWSRMPFPDTHNESLTSVIAFGANSVYITAQSGRVYRYNGTQWQIIHEDTSARFRDIAGTSPADLWIAGDNGQIFHWPQ
ncbi:putative lipoprotein [Myxococcus hansupus]|uniref:Putative lipoprotein n=1 Tax=Pseudomyxococcus hansupus TaxID=1297742 RepID=A0A0H4XH98_9BACT|nr:putative metal-binding motif-containing protein [Myxococcus hansupus]AKQ67577.1 putative lipoprotein [Myxococcus hansupus]